MKILIRISGLCVIAIIMTNIVINLVNINVIINELNNVSALAVINAQEFAIKTITSKHMDIGGGRYVVSSSYALMNENSNEYKLLNDKYKQEFIDYFNYSVSDPGIYVIKKIETNINEGIIHVIIGSNKSSFIKDKELLNVVEFNKGYQHPIKTSTISYLKPEFEYYVIDDPKVYEIPKGINFNYLLKNTTWPITIYTWYFKDEITIGDYNICAYSCIDTAYDIRIAYWYPGLKLSAKNADGVWVTIDEKNQNKYTGQKTLSGNSSIKTKEVKLEVTAYKPKTGYEAKVNRFVVQDSYIGKGSKLYKEVIDWQIIIDESYIQGSRLIHYDYSYCYKEVSNKYLERLA